MSQYGYGPYDSAVELRDVADGEIGDTAAETGVAIDFDAVGDFKVVFNVTDVEASTDTEWTLSVEVDSASGFSTPIEVGSFSDVAAGVYELPLSGKYVQAKDASAAYIRAKATQTGAGGAITYGAHIVPVHK